MCRPQQNTLATFNSSFLNYPIGFFFFLLLLFCFVVLFCFVFVFVFVLFCFCFCFYFFKHWILYVTIKCQEFNAVIILKIATMRNNLLYSLSFKITMAMVQRESHDLNRRCAPLNKTSQELEFQLSVYVTKFVHY